MDGAPTVSATDHFMTKGAKQNNLDIATQGRTCTETEGRHGALEIEIEMKCNRIVDCANVDERDRKDTIYGVKKDLQQDLLSSLLIMTWYLKSTLSNFKLP